MCSVVLWVFEVRDVTCECAVCEVCGLCVAVWMCKVCTCVYECVRCELCTCSVCEWVDVRV